MTDWSRLGVVGRDKLISALPRGGGEPGTMFAMKIKKAAWEDGKYAIDVVVRTPDLSIVLASKRWDLYPSMLPAEIQEAIDYDVYDGTWFICETELNPNSKAGRSRFRLLDSQGGLSGDGPDTPAALQPATQATTQTGPSKPAAVTEADPHSICTNAIVLGKSSGGSERGQPDTPATTQTGPSKPAAGERAASAVVDDHAPARIAPDSERGQPGAGGAPEAAPTVAPGQAAGEPSQQRDTPPPAEPCLHPPLDRIFRPGANYQNDGVSGTWHCGLCNALLNDKGERVG